MRQQKERHVVVSDFGGSDGCLSRNVTYDILCSLHSSAIMSTISYNICGQ